MKEILIEQIKELIKINPNDSVEINPKYLEYFQEEELLEIKNELEKKKSNISQISNNYLNEIYEKTKKDEL